MPRPTNWNRAALRAMPDIGSEAAEHALRLCRSAPVAAALFE